jgi:hypothetical protein
MNTKYTNKRKFNRLYSALSASILFISAHSFANSGNEEKSIIVDETTPDSVLLEGKDKAEMFKVAQPSIVMTVSVEGLAEEVEVVYEDEGPVLLLEEGSDLEKEKLKETYTELTGNEDVTVNAESMDN